ncbi:5-formyltetrahydrofolate cyclo-ligase [bacterium]|nr:5-formyltetrahydrofolate cyclo-ligase [bacterium]
MSDIHSGSEKHILRERMKALRASMNIMDYRIWSNSIRKTCETLPELARSYTVHAYVSALNNEADTLGLILDLFEKGRKVVVPKCSKDSHIFYNIRIDSLDDLKPARFGLMEPDYNPEKEVRPEQLDIVIAPLLAFDRSGGRLGFGGGYYDYLLGRCWCPKVGIGFSFQEVDEVPLEIHDRKLDIIVTEREIVRV